MKAHVGNGTVYLTDNWVNVDLVRSGSALASDCPRGLAKWGTVSTDYYARLKHIDELYLGKGTPDHETTVTDRYGSWCNLPFEDDEVSEIYSVQVFEHLDEERSELALAETRRVMKTGGLLRLDMPDFDASFAEYVRLCGLGKTAQARFMKRHIFGSRKTDWAKHMGWWCRSDLIRFCARFGFGYEGDERNIHFYPAFCLRFRKLATCDYPDLDERIVPWKAAYEYCGEPLGTALTVPDKWKVLEVGPGNNPWPRANAYADIDERNLARIQDQYRQRPGVEWPEFAACTVERMPDGWSGKWDFVLTSHILEHVEDPQAAAAELSRVARGGCVVCPSPFKEGMFLAHELDHKWWVFAGRDCLYFKRIPAGMYGQVYDATISGEMHRIWRYGERRLETVCNVAKRHFHKSEPYLDTIHKWAGKLNVTVLE